MTYNEKELLIAVSRGDETAFAVIYNHFKDSIYHTAKKITSSSISAEETVQDVFLKFWIRRENAPEIDNVKAYLHKVAENLIYDAAKRLQKIQSLPELIEDTVSATPAILLEHKDFESILQNAISKLSPKQRETYILIKQQGLKRQEAAQVLKVSPETVKYNLEHAMRNIRANCLRELGVSAGILALLNFYF